MEKFGGHIKRWSFALVMIVLMLPLLQQQTRIFRENFLKGAFTVHEKPQFSKQAWLEGQYQQPYEDWLRDDIGFRHTLIRLHNQIEYSFFNTTSASSIVVGKDGYLYEKNYLTAYQGKDYLGDAEIDKMMHKLKQLQDTLASRNITLIVCLAAGKASYFPEYIPNEFLPAGTKTNYRSFAAKLDELNIGHIDFNSWFMQMKKTAPYPLYPKTGIHWSRYGSILVLDSVIRYIEHNRHIDMPSVILNGAKYRDTLCSPDGDIGETMNLLWPIPFYKMAYPEYTFEDTTGKAKIRMMTVSDSYFWQLFDIGLSPRCFSNVEFYYYNENVYHSDGREKTSALDQPGAMEAEQSNVIMLMATEANLQGYGWNFINEAYDHFVLKKSVEDEKMVRYYEQSIRLNKKWLMDVDAKAKAKGIPLDSMIHLDAVYMASQKK